MPNSYYNNDANNLSNGSIADADDVELKFTDVVTGFDLIEADILKHDGTVAMSADIDAGGNTITNLGTPSNPSDAVTKSYVDAQATANVQTFTAAENVTAGQALALNASGQVLPITGASSGYTFDTTDYYLSAAESALDLYGYQRDEVYLPTVDRYVIVGEGTSTTGIDYNVGNYNGTKFAWQQAINTIVPSTTDHASSGGLIRLVGNDNNNTVVLFYATSTNIMYVAGTVGATDVTWGTPTALSLSWEANIDYDNQLTGLSFVESGTVTDEILVHIHYYDTVNTQGYSVVVPFTIGSGSATPQTSNASAHQDFSVGTICTGRTNIIYDSHYSRYVLAHESDYGILNYFHFTNFTYDDAGGYSFGTTYNLANAAVTGTANRYGDVPITYYPPLNSFLVFLNYGGAASIKVFNNSAGAVITLADTDSLTIPNGGTIYGQYGSYFKYHSEVGEILLVAGNATGGDGWMSRLTHDGTTLTQVSDDQINNISSVTYNVHPNLTFDTNSNIISFFYSTSSYYLYSQSDINTGNSNVTDFIGLAAESFNAAASGAVTLPGGENTQQSGRTAGTLYYVSYDGTITTTPNPAYDSILLGRATATTKILIEGSSALTSYTNTSDMNDLLDDKMDVAGGSFTGAVSGLTPTSSGHLTTKGYVDGLVGIDDKAFTAAAGKSFTAGEPAVLDSSGNITNVVSTYTTPTLHTPRTFDNGDSDFARVKFFDTINTFIATYKDDSADDIYLMAGTTDAGLDNINWGTEVVLTTNAVASDYNAVCDFTYDPSSSTIVVAFFDSTTPSIVLRTYTLSGTTLSIGNSTTTGHTPNSSYPSVCVDYNPTQGHTVVVAHNSTTLYGYAVAVSGTTPSVSYSANLGVSGHYPYQLIYESVGGRFCYLNNASTPQVGMVTDTGSAFTLGSLISGDSLYIGASSICVDSANDQLIWMFDTDFNLNLRAYDISGVSLVYSHGTSGLDYSSVHNYATSLAYDATNQYIYLLSTNATDNDWSLYAFQNSGSAFTQEGATILVLNDNTAHSYRYSSMAIDESNGVMCMTYPTSSTPTRRYRAVEVITGTSNVSDFVGFVEDAITAGGTGTVSTFGAVNNSQTGRTIGATYYVEHDGTVTTAPDTTKPYKQAGVALSATDMLVTGVPE